MKEKNKGPTGITEYNTYFDHCKAVLGFEVFNAR